MSYTSSYYGPGYDEVKPVTPLSPEELENNARAEAEKQKRIAEASRQMDSSSDYSRVDKDKLNSGDYYWALVDDGKGNYSLKKIQYYLYEQYSYSNYGTDMYLELDNNNKIKKDSNNKNIEIDGNLIKRVWKKKFLSSLFRKPSARTYGILSAGGKSRRHRKNSLRKRMSKKSKKRRHTKRR